MKVKQVKTFPGRLSPLLRGIPVIILTAVASVLLAKKYLRYTTPIYESTAKIKLADTHEGVANGNLFKDFDVFANTNKIGAEVELLKSKSLVGKALASLNLRVSIFRVGDLHKTELYDQSPFYVESTAETLKMFDRPFSVSISGDSLVSITTPSGELVQTHLDKAVSCSEGVLTLKRNTALLKVRSGLQVNGRYEIIIHSPGRLVDDVISSLDVMAVDKDIPVLRISYKSAVPRKAADVVNALSAAYITDYVDEKFRSADTTSDFLDRQLHEYAGKLASSENAIENYRTANNIINIRQETETDLRKIADLKKQLASVQMNLNAIDSLNTYMANGKDRFLELAPNFEAFTDLLSTELIKKTKELQREKRDLLIKYTPEHEKVKVVDDKLDDIARYVQESIHNTETALHIKYNDLESTIAESEKVFTGLPTREKNMTIMERNFGLNEQIYRFLHEKRTEADIAKAATISFHRVISAGEIPAHPVSPNTTIIKVMAVLLGIFGGIALVYGVHIIKARVGHPDTISRLSATPVVAVPFCTTDNFRRSFFQRWALQLEIKGLLAKGTVICVSSFNEHEGKRFIADNLAIALEQQNKKVLNVVAEDMPGGDLHLSGNWKKYLSSKTQEFDVVLIRNFSMNRHPSAIMLMADAGINLFVVDSRRTKKNCIIEADLVKEELRLKDMQFVLNRSGYIPSIFTQLKEGLAILHKKIRR